MPIVRMPDGTQVGFPDEMPPEEIKSMIASKFPFETPSKEPGNDMGRIASTVEGFNTLVPAGRKITSALGAGIAKLGTDESFKDLYNQAEADSAATTKAHPGYYTGGIGLGVLNSLLLAKSAALSGEVPTTGARGALNAIPQKLAAVGDFARRGNLAVRSAKGAALAAPMGALYGAGDSATGEELSGAKRGAGVAAGIGAALPVAGAILGSAVAGTKNLYKGATARTIDELSEAGSGIKAGSRAGYNKMREIGAVFTPQAKREIFNTINTDILKDGPLNQGLHGSTMSLVDDLQKAAREPGFGLEELDQYRRLFSRIPRSNTEDVRKASIVIDSLDDVVNSLKDKAFSVGGKDAVDALNMARQEYNRFSKFDRIASIIKETGGDANKIKSALQRFANNPKKTRGFTAEEVAIIQDAAKNTTGEGLLKLAGKFGVDLGSSLSVGNAGLPGLISGGSLMAGSGGTGAAVVAGGTAARQAQKWIARGKVENILNMIEKGGKVTAKEIGELPPSDAKRLMEMIKLQTGNVSATQSVPR